MDFNGICQGQIKIAVTPHEMVESVTNPVHRVDSYCSVRSAGLSIPKLPNHVSSVSKHLDPESRGVLARFSQHYENVKHYHETLASRLGTQPEHTHMPCHEVPEVSRSALFRSLRSNMADLDNITGQLKNRLHGIPVAAPYTQSPQELNQTGHSSQTEPETSALSNSQQFLPLPTEVPSSSTEVEPRTMENTKASALSTALDTLSSTGLSDLPSGMSTLLSGAVKDTIEGLLDGERSQDSGQHHDSILASGPLLDGEEEPFGSYNPLYHHSSGNADNGERWQREDQRLADMEEADGYIDNYDYNSQDDEGGDIIVPRALNDISNVNFNNMLSQISNQDYSAKIIEEDSWFNTTSPRRMSQRQCTVETVTDEANPNTADQSENQINPEGLTDTGVTLGETGTTLGGTVTTLGGTVTSLGGTVTSIGSVAEDDPYGRTLLGGRLNRATKLTLNYDDSWATNNEIDIEYQEDVHEEKLLEEPLGGRSQHRQDSEPEYKDEELERSVLSPEEKSLIMEEDPLAVSSVSRTTLSESNSHKVNQVRKAAMYRREYERHRSRQSTSSEPESDSADSEAGSRVSSRNRHRRPRSRASPNKKRESSPRSPTPLKELILEGGSSYAHDNHSQSAQIAYNRDKNDQVESGEDENMPRSYNPSEKCDSHTDTVTPRSEDQGSATHQEIETTVSEAGEVTLRNTSKSSSNSVPNFFLPSSDLEQSMRALRTATLNVSGGSSVADQSGGSARSLHSGRFLGTSSARTKPLPGQQHTQRIAKIFSSKFTS